VAAPLIAPLLVIGGADYPDTEWRRGLLWIVVSALVGFSVQRLVTRSRGQVREQRDEREFVDAVLGIAGSLVMVTDREGRIERFNKGVRACHRVHRRRGAPPAVLAALAPRGGRRGSGELRATHRG